MPGPPRERLGHPGIALDQIEVGFRLKRWDGRAGHEIEEVDIHLAARARPSRIGRRIADGAEDLGPGSGLVHGARGEFFESHPREPSELRHRAVRQEAHVMAVPS
jgi:hypothetical protein